LIFADLMPAANINLEPMMFSALHISELQHDRHVQTLNTRNKGWSKTTAKWQRFAAHITFSRPPRAAYLHSHFPCAADQTWRVARLFQPIREQPCAFK
jgi:hypothetical protein